MKEVGPTLAVRGMTKWTSLIREVKATAKPKGRHGPHHVTGPTRDRGIGAQKSDQGRVVFLTSGVKGPRGHMCK